MRDVAYMQWLSAQMAACLLSVAQTPQIARFCTFSISTGKHLSLHQCKLSWCVSLPWPAPSVPLNQAAESSSWIFGKTFYIAITVFLVTCQGHRDWLFGVTWLTDRHLVTGDACCVHAPHVACSAVLAHSPNHNSTCQAFMELA